jgi:IPT/TIG domain
MPLGLNRSGDYRNGFPVTLPLTFGTPITSPHDFGNDVTLPKNFGNQPPFNPGNVISPPNPAPTITPGGISPSSGSLNGGTALTITGTGFLAGATVTVDGTSATSVVVVSSTSITCVTPAGAIGAATVVVTNTDSQSATDTNDFSYAANATFIASISAIDGIATVTGVNGSGNQATINTTGATLLVAVCWDSNVLPGIKDASTFAGLSGVSLNTWVLATTNGVVPVGNDCSVAVYYCVSPTTSATHAFGPTLQGPNYGAVQVYAFSGATDWTVDVFSIGGPNSGSSVTTNSITPTQAGDVIVAGYGSNGGAPASSSTINNGFAGGQGVAVGNYLPQLNGVSEVGGSGYLIDNAHAAINATLASATSNPDWATVICAFKG